MRAGADGKHGKHDEFALGPLHEQIRRAVFAAGSTIHAPMANTNKLDSTGGKERGQGTGSPSPADAAEKDKRSRVAGNDQIHDDETGLALAKLNATDAATTSKTLEGEEQTPRPSVELASDVADTPAAGIAPAADRVPVESKNTKMSMKNSEKGAAASKCASTLVPVLAPVLALELPTPGPEERVVGSGDMQPTSHAIKTVEAKKGEREYQIW